MADNPTRKQHPDTGLDANEILRYTSGQMSDAEAQQMEAAALQDPFLADALEGIENTADKKRLEQLAYSLNQDLKRRLSNKRKARRWIGLEVPAWWPWITLILLMLIAIAFLFILKMGS